MSDPGLPARVPSRATAAVLTAGSLLSAGVFLVAVLLVLAGKPGGPGSALDPASALSGLTTLDPHAWASMGVLVLLVTPVAGLLTTAAEYWRPERRFALVALLVLAVLAVSLAVAWLR
jgi:uncharacterized membrane protein